MCKEPWVMPEWMEPYRECFTNTGSNSVEYCMNWKGSSFTNVIMYGIVAAVEGQVNILHRLREQGLIATEYDPSAMVMVAEVAAFIDVEEAPEGEPDETYAQFQIELVGWAYDATMDDLQALNWVDGERRRFALVPIFGVDTVLMPDERPISQAAHARSCRKSYDTGYTEGHVAGFAEGLQRGVRRGGL